MLYVSIWDFIPKKILKTLKHPTETYPKSNDTDELQIKKLEPIERRG